MRRLVCGFLVFLLALSACTAFALVTIPFSEMKKSVTYQTNGDIVVHVPENDTSFSYDYYGNLESFVFDYFNFVAKLNNEDAVVFPNGSLEISGGAGSGARLALIPEAKDGKNVPYSVVGYRNAFEAVRDTAGGDVSSVEKIIWNIFTAPDLLVGSSELPDTSSKSIGENDIVPYIEPVIEEDGDGDKNVTAIKVKFIRRTDIREKKAVAPSYDSVFVSGYGIGEKVKYEGNKELTIGFDVQYPYNTFFDPEGGAV